MVRRRGYDPVEVDAVMDRLVATLETHERVNADLQGHVTEADESVEAVRRTFHSAQQTKRQMIAEGQEEADDLVREARAEADGLLKAARTSSGDILAAAATDAERTRSEVTATLADASSTATARLEQADAEADAIRADVEGLIADAQIRSASLLEEATLEARAIRVNATTEADGILETARSQSEEKATAAESMAAQLVADARRRSEGIINAARREEAQLRGHLARLDLAVSDVEDRIEVMARTAKDRTASISEAIEVANDGPRTLGAAVAQLGAGYSDGPAPVVGAQESVPETRMPAHPDTSQGHSMTPAEWLLDQTGSGRS
jgi:cell division septum initiation protein DivIVA